jgi:hypothetical protein
MCGEEESLMVLLLVVFSAALPSVSHLHGFAA